MDRWLVVPYDGSAAAHATLRRAAAVVATAHAHRSCGLLLATVGLERPALAGPVAEVAERVGPARVGPAGPVAVVWLSPADPIGAFHVLLAATDATLAVPLGGRGRAPWYAEACRASDASARTMLVFLTPRELRSAQAALSDYPRAGGSLGMLRWPLVPLFPRHVPQRARDYL